MQLATLGKSGSEAASQLQGRVLRAFSSNSLVNTMDMTAAIQYILTAAQLLGSRAYNKVSNDDTWACWCIILRNRAGIDRMDYHIFQRRNTYLDAQEAWGGLKATAGNRVKCALADYAQTHVSTYWTLWA